MWLAAAALKRSASRTPSLARNSLTQRPANAYNRTALHGTLLKVTDNDLTIR